MAKRSLSICVLSLLAAAALVAAPRATLTLRNGDKVQAELVDLGGVGFTIRSGTSTQTLSENDVAFIDFAGSPSPAAEVNAMQNGNPFIALRNGDIVSGRLIDIGGNDPLRLTVRTPNGNQDFSSNDVARIFLAKWNGMPGPAAQAGQAQGQGQGQGQGRGQGQTQGQTQGRGQGQGSGQGQAQGRRAQGQGQTFALPADQCWVRTGIQVQTGDLVAFNASGEIYLSGDPKDVAGPAGSRIGRTARVAPIPDTLLGALIGRIDNRRPFGIGDMTQALTMPASGELWIGINDNPCQDNRGEYRVTITLR